MTPNGASAFASDILLRRLPPYLRAKGINVVSEVVDCEFSFRPGRSESFRISTHPRDVCDLTPDQFGPDENVDTRGSEPVP